MNNLLYNTKKLLDINNDGRSKEFKKVEFLSWCSGNESDWEPRGLGFDPRHHSVG